MNLYDFGLLRGYGRCCGEKVTLFCRKIFLKCFHLSELGQNKENFPQSLGNIQEEEELGGMKVESNILIISDLKIFFLDLRGLFGDQQ